MRNRVAWHTIEAHDPPSCELELTERVDESVRREQPAFSERRLQAEASQDGGCLRTAAGRRRGLQGTNQFSVPSELLRELEERPDRAPSHENHDVITTHREPVE